MNAVRTGIIYSSLSRYGLKLIALISSVLFARLLTPVEIGTFAIASSLVMLLAEVRLLGASVYLVREQELTEEKIRNAYGLTLIMCWGISFAIMASAPVLAAFFNLPELELVFFILAGSFLFVPYISIPDALLSRDYCFKEIMIIRVVPSVFQVIFTLYLIDKGYSFYALAWGHFIGMALQVILSLYLTRNYPIYLPKFNKIAQIAKLGLFTSFSNILRRTQFTASDLVIGKLGSPAQVGMFSRGMGFVDFVSQSFTDGISPVVLPYLAEAKRKGLDVAAAYQKVSVLLVSIIWPVMAVGGVASLPAIRLLFGDQWDAAAPVASLLAIWVMLKTIHGFSGYALLAAGYEKVMLLKDLIVFSSLIPILIMMFPFGLEAMAYGFILSGLIDFIASSYVMRRKLNLNFIKFCYSLLPAFLTSIVCLLLSLSIDFWIDFSASSPVSVFLTLCMTLPLVWLFMVFILKQPIYFEVSRLFSYIYKFFYKKLA